MRRLGAEGGGSEVGAKAKEEGQKESGYDRKLRSLGQEDQDPHGGGNGNPLQYSCLENSMDRGAWQATVQRVRHD